MRATLDASVIVKWYIATPDEQQAFALLEGIENNVITLVQPPTHGIPQTGGADYETYWEA